ncbi:MAG: hypothetical protein V9E94_17230 [Microthrixaceae bacterium]
MAVDEDLEHSARTPAAVGVLTAGLACFAVRALCQKITSRPRARVKTNCDRFSRPRSKHQVDRRAATRHTSAPATRSTTSTESSQSLGDGWQYTFAVRGQVSRTLSTTP